MFAIRPSEVIVG